MQKLEDMTQKSYKLQEGGRSELFLLEKYKVWHVVGGYCILVKLN